MKKLATILSLSLLFGVSFPTAFAQDRTQHQHDNDTADHSQHQAGDDHMAHLDADLEAIRKTDDPVKRKQMLQHHLQMMQEHIRQMHASMEHGGMKMEGMDKDQQGGMARHGEGSQDGMMMHHQHMGKMMEHMLAMQELMLGLIDAK